MRDKKIIRKDVGKMKVDAALENSVHHNINKIEIVGFNLDATKSFDQIIEFVKQSTIVFNMIDVGIKYKTIFSFKKNYLNFFDFFKFYYE